METFVTFTESEVMPVWSLKALAGIDELPELLPPTEVVVVEDELVELQATVVSATNMTSPRAAVRVFDDAEPKAPPCTDRRRVHVPFAAIPG
ncbi:MAG TPA: hypothetical protein VFC03_20815 [Acidimicrobiales bacterium]|nr:hypothetical protein [Acidimicrobiales bacterium]